MDEITEASISRVAGSGEAYLHTSPAKDGKPVIVVASAKHFPNVSFSVYRNLSVEEKIIYLSGDPN